MITAGGCRGKVNTHTLHSGFARHVNNGLIVAVAQAAVPSFEVGRASGVMGRAGGHRRPEVAHTGRLEVKAK